jgi:hypothetical protein
MCLCEAGAGDRTPPGVTAPDDRFQNGSMSTTTPSRQKSAGTDRRTALAPPRHAYLGVDAEGYHHHVDRDARLVYRFDTDGMIERTTPLRTPDDTDLERYIHDHVAAAVGWADRRYVTTRDVWGDA